MNKDSKIFVAGHKGLVGSAIVQCLRDKGYNNFVLRTHKELDLENQADTEKFFSEQRPEYVFLAAAYVGGIGANNTLRADFIYHNLQIQNNVIYYSYKYNVKKLLFLGSTCIYPKNAPQPMNEDCLLTSELEYTNEPYAVAKIAGMKMCESFNIQYNTDFIAVMPTNLYGPNDNFDLKTSHVLPALLRKIYLGKCLMDNDWDSIRKDLNTYPVDCITGRNSKNEIIDKLSYYGIYKNEDTVKVEIWGTGSPLREFLWSYEMAQACVFLMENISFKDLKSNDGEIRNSHINIGTGKEISIKDLTDLICKEVGYNGQIYFNSDKPDGTPRKLTDVSRIHRLGWHHNIETEEGIKLLFSWYKDNQQ